MKEARGHVHSIWGSLSPNPLMTALQYLTRTFLYMYCEPVIKRRTNCYYVFKLVLAHLIILEDFCSSSAGTISFALPNSWSLTSTNELTASFGLLQSTVLAMVGSLIGFTFPNWKVSLLWNSTLDAWKGDTNNIISFQCNFHF